MDQIPHGPADKFCPDWKKAMSKVCHTCPLWMPVDLKVNGKDVTDWRCAKLVSAQAALVSVTRLEARMEEIVKEVNELRNETKKAHDSNVTIGAIAVHQAKEAVKGAFQEALGIGDGRRDVKLIS
jgi:hypothetical protein